MIAQAPKSTNDTVYSFKRGTHRTKMIVGGFNMEKCIGAFMEMITRESLDAVSAWKKHGRNCGKMLVEEGLIDRDLGPKQNDAVMQDFINAYLTHHGSTVETCKENVDCTATGLGAAVDQENWLKNFAVYAVSITLDSPLGNGNNYFLAQTGDGKGWKMVQYDHNNAFQQVDIVCPCRNDPIHWAITRPSCGASESSQLVGPLLSDSVLFKRYIDHVRTFTKTVFTNTSLLAEMVAHAQSIAPFVRSDPWSFGYDYSQEISGTPWREGAKEGTLLGFFRQRAASVQDQLQALEDGSFPRMPENVEVWEACQDWRSKPVAPVVNTGASSQMIYGSICPEAWAECNQASTCFDHNTGCSASGKFTFAECQPAAPCAPCFPNSRCGTLKETAGPTAPAASSNSSNGVDAALGSKVYVLVASVSASIAIQMHL